MGMLWVPIQTTIIALNDMLAKFEFYGLSGITNIKRPQTHSQSRIKQYTALVFKVREVIYLIYCTLLMGWHLFIAYEYMWKIVTGMLIRFQKMKRLLQQECLNISICIWYKSSKRVLYKSKRFAGLKYSQHFQLVSKLNL